MSLPLFNKRPNNMFSMSSLTGSTTIHIPNPDRDSGDNIIATMVNSGRNSLAIVVAQKIGRDQEKTQLKWSALTKEEWESMLRFWNNNFFFNFHYYSRAHGTKITRKFYIGDRTDRPYDIDSNGIPTAYLSCSANMVDTGEGA